SAVGASLASVRSELGGQVIFENPVWKNNRESGFVARNWSSRGPLIQLINPSVINPNTNGSTSVNYGAAYLIYRAPNDIGDENIGNVQLIRPRIQDTRTPQKVTSSYCFRDIAKDNIVKNITLVDPVKSVPKLGNRY